MRPWTAGTRKTGARDGPLAASPDGGAGVCAEADTMRLTKARNCTMRSQDLEQPASGRHALVFNFAMQDKTISSTIKS